MITVDDVAGLLAYLEVDSLEAAGDLVSEETDPDTWFVMEEGELVARMATLGCVVTFPLSVTDFWDLIQGLERDVVDILESEWESEMPWDSSEVLPSGEPARIAKYRRLQSWYRANVLNARAGAYRSYQALGSYLHADDVAANPRLNFLSDAALAHAEERIVEVQREGGSLDPVRLRHNMLSSMPLCFNLFGTMRAEPDFLTVFQKLFDSEATAITDIVCEWAPQPASAFLGDRTAFDAVVFYETAVGARFCGIETKYTESFSVTEYDSPTYAAVTRESGWFADPEEAWSALRHRRSNQLWRNVLLAAAVERTGAHGTAWVAVVALSDDPGAEAATATVSGALKEANRLQFVSLESIVDAAAQQPSLEAWSNEFRRRYLTPVTTASEPEGDS